MAAQPVENRFMQCRAAARHDTAMAGMDRELAAFPIGDRAAGIAHDRRQRAVVERIEPAIEADVERAIRDPAIGVAAAAIDAPLRIAAQALEGGTLAGVEWLGIAVAEDGIGQRCPLTGLDRLAIAARRQAVAADPALRRDGVVDDAEDRRALVGQSDQRAEGRDARDEGLGAVDRVDDPDEVTVEPDGFVFLAEDAVIGMGDGDLATQAVLDSAVDLGDRAVIGLGVEAAALGDGFADDRATAIGEPLGETGEGVDVRLGLELLRRSPPWCWRARAGVWRAGIRGLAGLRSGWRR
jgi:hypothetical protein